MTDMGRLPVLFTAILLAMLIPVGCSLPYINRYGDALSPEEHFKLATAYEQNGEYEAAIREYRAASGKIAEAHYYLGNIYFTQGDYQNAEKNYKLAIEKLPQDPRGYNNLAWLYFVEKKNLKQAESLALKGLQLAPREGAGPYHDTLEKIRQEQNKEQSP
jgi:tetratricopeptide (TPR) repeat protein